MARLRVALAVGLVLGAALSAEAFHNPPMPLRDRVFTLENSYVAWRIEGPQGAAVGIEAMGVLPQSNHFHFGLWMVELASGTAERVWTGYTMGDPVEAGLRAHVAGSNQVFFEFDDCHLVPVILPGGSCGGGAALDHTLPSSGEWVLVAIAGTDAAWNGDFRLYADLEVRVLGRTEGPAFLYQVMDFDSLFTAHANVFMNGGTIMVKGLAGESARSSMFAAFFGTSVVTTALHYEDPLGQASYGQDAYFLNGTMPGRYRFWVDSYINPSPLLGGLALLGADVQQP